MELATLAALLLPDHSPELGLDRAMRFYVRAVLFLRTMPVDVWELVTLYGSWSQAIVYGGSGVRSSQKTKPEQGTDVLSLDPDKDTDEAREFLNGRAIAEGIQGKNCFASAKQVLDKLRELSGDRSEKLFKATLLRMGILQQPDDRPDEYSIPKWLLLRLIADLKQVQGSRASARAKKGAETKRLRKAGSRSVK